MSLEFAVLFLFFASVTLAMRRCRDTFSANIRSLVGVLPDTLSKPTPVVYEVQIFGGDTFVLPWPSFLSYIPSP